MKEKMKKIYEDEFVIEYADDFSHKTVIKKGGASVSTLKHEYHDNPCRYCRPKGVNPLF